jgi:hypothetical protein
MIRFLTILCAAGSLLAQSDRGTLTGLVLDPAGAALPNARVEAVNQATQVKYTGVSSDAGLYSIPQLPVGRYDLSVAATGFSRYLRKDIDINIAQTVTINVNLALGAVNETVEVSGVAQAVQTSTSDIGTVVDRRMVIDLPLAVSGNMRNPESFIFLAPGVTGDTGNTQINGSQSRAKEVLFDGVGATSPESGGTLFTYPSVEAVSEFKLLGSNFSAEFGRTGGGFEVFNSKSGTNEFHGSAFDYLRNNVFDARGFYAKVAPVNRQNEFGGSIGGPMRIPGVYNGKNKTFWFVDWEGMKERQDLFAITAVHTAAIWNGDLSSITDSSGNKYTVYDPSTTSGPNGARTPFPNNVIPTSRLSPYAKIFQGVSPTPNISGNLNPWIEQNFETYYSKPTNQHSLTIKIDHNFSEKDSISGRFTESPYFNAQYGGRYGYPPPGCTNCGGTTEVDANVYSTYVRWNHVFSPTFLNELQLSAHRSPTHYGTLGDSTNWANKLGLPNPFGVTGWPTVYAAGSGDPFGNMLYYGGWDGDNNHHQNLTSYEIDDNVTWIKGKHTIKFGFKGRKEYNNVEELQQAEGSHSFYANWTALYDPSAQGAAPYTGTGLAELLLGLPTALRNQYNRGYFYFQQKELGLYVDDTWKLSPRLTVSAGLRWDHWTPYHEAQNRLVNLDPASYAGFTVISPGSTTIESLPNVPSGVLASWKARGLSWVTADSTHGFPGALIPNYWKDFGPRLAAAYRISDKWVVRAGYGIYYWPMPLSQILQASRTNPPLNLDFVNHRDDLNGTFPNRALLTAPGANDVMPNVQVDVAGVQGISSTSQGIFIFDPHHWADDRMQQWTFTVERELMRNTSLRLSYIGNHGSNLEQRLAWNSPQAAWNYQTQTGLAIQPGGAGTDLRRSNPNWHGTDEAHVGYSNANSFQAEIQRRFANGLAFQWFYTYNHTLSTSDSGGTSDGGDGALVPENSTLLGNPNLSLSQRLKLVYANSALVPPQRITWNGIYELPFGKGKHFASHVSGPLNQVVGGWQVAFLGTWSGGNWIGVNQGGGFQPNNSEYLFGNAALDPSQRLKLTIFGKNQQLWFKGDFNPTSATNVNLSQLEQLVPVDRSQRTLRPLGSDFSNRLPFRLANGTVRPTSITDLFTWNPQNFMLSPGNWNEDLSIFKYFNIVERVKVRFAGDFFNLFNHPVDYLSSATQDLNKNTGLLDLSRQVNDPRIIQFSLRLEF